MRYHLSAVGAGFAAALFILFHSPSHAAQGRNAAAAAGLAVGAAGLYMLMQGRSQAEPIVEEEVIVERRRPLAIEPARIAEAAGADPVAFHRHCRIALLKLRAQAHDLDLDLSDFINP
jgi:hypothetical protein